MSFAYMQLYTGDYLRDTRHLTPAKHGIYLLALMYCWDSKGPMPLDEQECAGIVNARSLDEVGSMRYVLNRFFVRMEDGYYNKRMQHEVERCENLSRSRSNAGRRGYEAKAKHLPSNCQAIAKQLPLSPSPSPSPYQHQHQEEKPTPPTPPSGGTPAAPSGVGEPSAKTAGKKASAAGSEPAGFDSFWRAYPRKVGKGEARKVFERIKPDDELLARMLAAVKAQKASEQWLKDGGQYIPHPGTWLRQERWDDDGVVVQRGAKSGKWIGFGPTLDPSWGDGPEAPDPEPMSAQELEDQERWYAAFKRANDEATKVELKTLDARRAAWDARMKDRNDARK